MPIPEWIQKWIDKEDEELLYDSTEPIIDPGDIPSLEELHQRMEDGFVWDTLPIDEEHSEDFDEWREDYGS